MALDRTNITPVDDDGTETTGTVLDAAFFDAIYDEIDAYAALLGPSEDIPFFNMAGPTALRTFTFPDVNATVYTDQGVPDTLAIGSATFAWNASALEIDEEIRIVGGGSSTALFGVNNTSASLRAFATDVAGDSFNRFTMMISGEIRWGVGSSDLDTLFYRVAEAELGLFSINGNDATLSVSSAASKTRAFVLKTGVERRWAFFADSVAEAGANAGSDFGIARYDDDGNYLGTAFTINRASGTVGAAGSIVLGADVWTGNTTFMHRTTATLTNGAGAGAGTLTNAPSAGNPTKWIAIEDNGVTRYLPSWT